MTESDYVLKLLSFTFASLCSTTSPKGEIYDGVVNRMSVDDKALWNTICSKCALLSISFISRNDCLLVTSTENSSLDPGVLRKDSANKKGDY